MQLYTNYQLMENPSFKMPKEYYNVVINSLSKEGDKPVKVAIVVRTTNTNLVAEYEGNFVFTEEVHDHNMEGYFSVVASVREVILKAFTLKNLGQLNKTVLMPIGAFEDNGQMFLYFNLIIQDDMVEDFWGTNIKYTNIENLQINEGIETYILPTLSIVK